jgi:phage gp29-like protein
MRKLFHRLLRRRGLERELAPQLTVFQRKALEYASSTPGRLPYEVYDQMEHDAMVQTALTLKRLGVLAAPYRIVPAGDSSAARRNATYVESQFQAMRGSPETILAGAMDAFSKGWSVQEMLWETDGRLLRLAEVKPKDPSLFVFEMDAFGNLERLLLQLPGESPRELPRGKFALYFHRPGYARAKGRSDLDAAHRHWQSKGALLNAWKLHLERFASPTVLGKFERGLSSEEQAAILAALQNLHQNTAIVYPQEIEIGTLGGSREPSTGFVEAIEFHNREIARSILGQTLTTDEGRRVGSLALGKVHLQVLLLQLEGLRKELADVVMTEQVIRPMVELNFGPEELPRFEFEPVSLSAFSSGELK